MSWILRVRERFQAAHFLKEYKGKCEKIHGHTFQVEIALKVSKLDKAGLGIDFTKNKKLSFCHADPVHTTDEASLLIAKIYAKQILGKEKKLAKIQ